MSFKLSECSIPSIWCGDGDIPKRKSTSDMYYYKTGTRYECMKKGIGVGIHGERGKNLSENSLQNIKYVGEVYENKFKKYNISTLSEFRKWAENKSSSQIQTLLNNVFVKKNKILDQRAYNSTLIYLYRHGMSNLPKCSKIIV